MPFFMYQSKLPPKKPEAYRDFSERKLGVESKNQA